MANRWSIFPSAWWPRRWWPYISDVPDVPAVEVTVDLRPAAVSFIVREAAASEEPVSLGAAATDYTLSLPSAGEEPLDLSPANIEVILGGMA
jgi:hypothetical protein